MDTALCLCCRYQPSLTVQGLENPIVRSLCFIPVRRDYKTSDCSGFVSIIKAVSYITRRQKWSKFHDVNKVRRCFYCQRQGYFVHLSCWLFNKDSQNASQQWAPWLAKWMQFLSWFQWVWDIQAWKITAAMGPLSPLPWSWPWPWPWRPPPPPPPLKCSHRQSVILMEMPVLYRNIDICNRYTVHVI